MLKLLLIASLASSAHAIDPNCTLTTNLGQWECPEDSVDWFELITSSRGLTTNVETLHNSTVSIASGAGLDDGAITTGKIADGAVTSISILDLSVSELDIRVGAVTTSKIADGAATTSKLGEDSVTTLAVIDGAITTSKLAEDSVTFAKMSDNGCSLNEIPKIAAGGVWACGADSVGSSGSIVSATMTMVCAEFSGGTVPIDDTIPAQSETQQWVSSTHTLTDSTNRYRVTMVAQVSGTVSARMIVLALFEDDASAAITVVSAEVASNDHMAILTLVYEAAGYSGARLFSGGIGSESVGLALLNKTNSFSLWGTAGPCSTILIEEITP